jgi:hypothetical protein
MAANKHGMNYARNCKGRLGEEEENQGKEEKNRLR